MLVRPMSCPSAFVGVPSPSRLRRFRFRQVAVRHAQRQSLEVKALLAVSPDSVVESRVCSPPLDRETLLKLCPRLRLGHRIFLALAELIPSGGEFLRDFDTGDSLVGVGVSGHADTIHYNGNDNDEYDGSVGNGIFGHLAPVWQDNFVELVEQQTLCELADITDDHGNEHDDNDGIDAGESPDDVGVSGHPAKNWQNNFVELVEHQTVSELADIIDNNSNDNDDNDGSVDNYIFGHLAPMWQNNFVEPVEQQTLCELADIIDDHGNADDDNDGSVGHDIEALVEELAVHHYVDFDAPCSDLVVEEVDDALVDELAVHRQADIDAPCVNLLVGVGNTADLEDVCEVGGTAALENTIPGLDLDPANVFVEASLVAACDCSVCTVLTVWGFPSFRNMFDGGDPFPVCGCGICCCVRKFSGRIFKTIDSMSDYDTRGCGDLFRGEFISVVCLAIGEGVALCANKHLWDLLSQDCIVEGFAGTFASNMARLSEILRVAPHAQRPGLFTNSVKHLADSSTGLLQKVWDLGLLAESLGSGSVGKKL
mmetsp:Transcript_35438/g.114721  ORF Transcript_35438/g.114721 Transcript_35438/m.114721 type:complete len:539 (+) Transcript_35438:613-2229(+)